MSAFELHQGSSPVILGLPHTGTDVPEDIWARLNDNGRILADTDWHIHQLTGYWTMSRQSAPPFIAIASMPIAIRQV